MIPAFLLDQLAVVQHYELVEDPKGDPVRGLVSTTSYHCRLDQRATREDEINAQTVLTDKIIFLPAGAVISADDDVLIDGVTYKVEGDPLRARAFGSEHHVEAQLRSIAQEVS